jgi:hypothetical protein
MHVFYVDPFPNFLYSGYRVLFLGVKRPGRDVDHRPLLDPMLKKCRAVPLPPPPGLCGLLYDERYLYLYLSSPVIRRTLSVPLPFIACYTKNVIFTFTFHHLLYDERYLCLYLSSPVMRRTLSLPLPFIACYRTNVIFTFTLSSATSTSAWLHGRLRDGILCVQFFVLVLLTFYTVVVVRIRQRKLTLV